jgi:hypothetical protein
MPLIRFFLRGLGAEAFVISTAQAQQPIPMSPELKAFLTRPAEQQAYSNVMRQQWQAAVENCPTNVMKGLNVIVFVPPKFDSGGTPTSGTWRVVGQVEGCGQNRLLNVHYQVGPDGRMTRVGSLPGSTIADLRLQIDGLLYATQGMVKLMPAGCKDIKYVDTKFMAFQGPAPATPNGPRSWTEEWTVRACGVAGVVTMHFAPNATGVNILVNLGETRKIGP